MVMTTLESYETIEDAKCAKIPGTLNGLIKDYPKVPTIYKISHPNYKELYVGQTIDFDSRRDNHFFKSRTANQKVYQFIKDHGDWDEWKMERIKEYPDATPDELDRLERYWWRRLGAKLNTTTPGTNVWRYRGSDQEFEERVSEGLPRDSKEFSVQEVYIDM